MRAIVTGGAGFIGSNLTDRLVHDDHEVIVIDDLSTGDPDNLVGALATGRCELVEATVTGKDAAAVIAKASPEVIFHLAAQADVRVSVANPVFDVEVNVLGSVNVFEAAANSGVRRVVFASSGGTIYGEPDSIPVAETAPQRPLNPYGVAKKSGGDYLWYYHEIRGIETVALALANVYGPRQDPNGEAGVVAIFSGLMAEGETPTIYGDGGQTRDFVYVGDVVEAFVAASEKGDGLLCNIGTGVETSVLDLYNELARAMGFEAEPIFGEARTGELLHVALDAGLAHQALGWRAEISLADGLARTVDWVRHDEARRA